MINFNFKKILIGVLKICLCIFFILKILLNADSRYLSELWCDRLRSTLYLDPEVDKTFSSNISHALCDNVEFS